MKKQIFLFSAILMVASNFVVADSCSSSCDSSCETSCSSSCSSSKSSCKSACVPDHGHTYRRIENAYQAATPMMVGMSQTNRMRNLEEDDKKGHFDITVYGGSSTHGADAACYFMPYGFSKYTVSGDVSDTAKTFVRSAAISTAKAGSSVAADDETGIGSLADFNTIAGNSPSEIVTDPATFKVDTNADKSILRPWNFGITYAALFEPTGVEAIGAQAGTGLVTSPEFKSTIAPELHRSRVGFGLGLRYHFSEDKQGFFGTLTTSVEHVRSRVCLNENVETEKTALTLDNFALADIDADITPSTAENNNANLYALMNTDAPASVQTVSTVAATPSIRAAYIGANGTGFPIDETTVDADNGGAKAPANLTEAFDQAAWKYGKIGCEQKETRLADIELAIGYQWNCSDCASHSSYVGLVIPTGNRVCADYVAPAVVGNGFHAGLMMGSSTELLLTDKEDYQLWGRVDTNSRYLFKNTQKRSFDLLGNEWSRYMMVWDSKETYATALSDYNDNLTPITTTRAYTPGINMFTEDMHVKPRFQGRVNSALYYRSDCFRAELGWNVFARQKECVELACDWSKEVAFADSSYVGGLGLNNSRTIYNDAQGATFNNIYDVSRSNEAGDTAITASNTALNVDLYDDFVITADQIDFNSAATPATISHTPYLTLGWTWDCEYKPQVSVGASYEFSASNAALNQWTVWGKFEMGF